MAEPTLKSPDEGEDFFPERVPAELAVPTPPESAWDCGARFYDLGVRVGKGAFADVYAASCIAGAHASERVAIKVSTRRSPASATGLAPSPAASRNAALLPMHPHRA